MRMVQVWVVIIGVLVCNRQIERQSNSLTPYTGVCGFFISDKFDTSVLALLPGGLKYSTMSPEHYQIHIYLLLNKIKRNYIFDFSAQSKNQFNIDPTEGFFLGTF